MIGASSARGLPPSHDARRGEELTFSIRRERRARRSAEESLIRQRVWFSHHLLLQILARIPAHVRRARERQCARKVSGGPMRDKNINSVLCTVESIQRHEFW